MNNEYFKYRNVNTNTSGLRWKYEYCKHTNISAIFSTIVSLGSLQSLSLSDSSGHQFSKRHNKYFPWILLCCSFLLDSFVTQTSWPWCPYLIISENHLSKEIVEFPMNFATHSFFGQIFRYSTLPTLRSLSDYSEDDPLPKGGIEIFENILDHLNIGNFLT